MSFSSEVKAEFCRIQSQKQCCAVAECYGILLYCNTFSNREIRIVTENRAFASRLPKLFKRAFGLNFDMLPDDLDKPGKLIYVIQTREKLVKIFDTYGYDADEITVHHINLSVLEEECCRHSFLRGAFLAGGSVTDPAKRYHLELVTSHYTVSREIFSLLLEVGFEPRDTSRNGTYITYFKQSEVIEDFLTLLGAPIAAMDIMSAKIEKDMRNSVNRRVNCDTANVSKMVNAAQVHIQAIQRIADTMGLDALPVKLQETARVRLENPDMSLAELAAISVPPVTKSCFSHRINKIIEISEQMKEGTEQ